MTTSAGLLLFRERDGELEVLLGHMGGPFWARKDEGAWSIPKGELEPGEEPLAGARREFAEELGHAPPDGPVARARRDPPEGRQARDRVRVEGDFDPATIVPGTFEMQWPPRSGRTQAFPEVDRVAWFDLATAAAKIVRGQVELLERLAAGARRPERARGTARVSPARHAPPLS